MTANQKKALLMNTTVIIGTQVANRVLDNHLAKDVNPGRFNKYLRKSLRRGRTWGLAFQLLGSLIAHEMND